MSKDKRIPWNKGKTGLQVAWNKGLKGIHLSPSSEFKKGHHNGIGRILSDITKRKISESRKIGFTIGTIIHWGDGKLRPEFSGTNHPMFGKHHTEESKKKNRLSHLGKHLSLSTEFKKGSRGFIGKHSEESRKKMSEYRKGKRIGKDNPFYGRHHTSEFIQRKKQQRALQVFPIKDTKIEVKVQDYLNQLGVSFNTHRQLDILHSYQTDIFIPSINLVIECDGDYWHANPSIYSNPNDKQLKQIEKDKIRTEELKEKGYNVLRLWESDIDKMSVEDLRIKLDENAKD